MLTLLSDAATKRPLLCVIDDAQWVDAGSAAVLSFVARRLLADPVGMLFAIRETAEPHPSLQVLPALRVTGLPEQDAYELLAAAVARPVHPDVAARIVAETEGNPLAIVEAAAGRLPSNCAGTYRCLNRCPSVTGSKTCSHGASGTYPRHAVAAPAGGRRAAGRRRSAVAGGLRAGHPGVRGGAG